MQYSNLDAHIKTMMQPCAWATQLEVVALATYFQVPVYIFTESTGQWERHKPHSSFQLSYKERVMTLSGAASELMRFELFHRLCHYDAVLPIHDQPFLDPPSGWLWTKVYTSYFCNNPHHPFLLQHYSSPVYIHWSVTVRWSRT